MATLRKKYFLPVGTLLMVLGLCSFYGYIYYNYDLMMIALVGGCVLIVTSKGQTGVYKIIKIILSVISCAIAGYFILGLLIMGSYLFYRYE